MGYIVLYTQEKPHVSYFGTILVAMGVYPLIAIAISWASGNAGGTLKRAVVIAIVVGVGNLGGYVLPSIV